MSSTLVPRVRLLGSGSPLVARASNLWRTAPVWRPDPHRFAEVWVALDGAQQTQSELAQLAAVPGPRLLVANLDDPKLALVAPRQEAPLWWVSVGPPQQRLGTLGEEVLGAWREEGDVLRFLGPEGERTFLMPDGFPEEHLLQALAGICVGQAFHLPAHTLQRWLQYLAASQVAAASRTRPPRIPRPSTSSLLIAA